MILIPQNLLTELDINKNVRTSLVSVGENLLHIPDVVTGVTIVEQRWDNSSKTLLGQKKELEQIAATWKDYEQIQQELKMYLEDAQTNLADTDLNKSSVDPATIEQQQNAYQVYDVIRQKYATCFLHKYY